MIGRKQQEQLKSIAAAVFFAFLLASCGGGGGGGGGGGSVSNTGSPTGGSSTPPAISWTDRLFGQDVPRALVWSGTSYVGGGGGVWQRYGLPDIDRLKGLVNHLPLRVGK